MYIISVLQITLVDSVAGNFLRESRMNTAMLALFHLMKPAIINFLIEP